MQFDCEGKTEKWHSSNVRKEEKVHRSLGEEYAASLLHTGSAWLDSRKTGSGLMPKQSEW